MYIKRICDRNVGPTKKVDIEFRQNNNKVPKPVIFVGENGTGKSTVLSNVVDAFYEMAGMAYQDVRKSEGIGYQYYKAISPIEINIGNEFLFSYIEFDDFNKENSSTCQYIFKSGQLSYEDFKTVIGTELKDKTIWDKDVNLKSVSISEDEVKKVFGKNIFCFFGPDRYEKPQWMGEKYYKTEQEENTHIGVI